MCVAYVNRSGFDLRHHCGGADLDAEMLQLFLGAAGEIFGIRGQDAGTAL